MLVELYGGPQDGATVDTEANHPDPELLVPIAPPVDLRIWDIHTDVRPEIPVARYRLITEPRWGSGARFRYSYAP